MPCIQFQCSEVETFERYFKIAVEARINGQCKTMLDAYIAYQNLSDHQNKNFWDFVSQQAQMSRERIYKYFRFTWSRKFYEPLTEHRDTMKAMVFKLLHSMKITEKTPEVNQQIWHQVWDIYKNYNLHYDGADQFVRNSVNQYFNKLQSGQEIEIADKFVLPPVPTEKNLATSKSKPKNVVFDGVLLKPSELCTESKRVQGVDNYQYFGMEPTSQQKFCLACDEPTFSGQMNEDGEAYSNVEPNDEVSVYESIKESFLGIVVQHQFRASEEDVVQPEFYPDPIDWEAM